MEIPYSELSPGSKGYRFFSKINNHVIINFTQIPLIQAKAMKLDRVEEQVIISLYTISERLNFSYFYIISY